MACSLLKLTELDSALEAIPNEIGVLQKDVNATGKA